MAPSAFFIVLSRPRCGSTSLCVALNAHRDIRCLFEPSFEMTSGDVALIRERLDDLRRVASGIKHVWEHAGPPFWPAAVHVAELEEGSEAVRLANLAVVRMEGARIIALHRRDQWARAVSHLLSQQTDLWGMSYRGGQWELDEPSIYRDALRARQIAPIDPDLLDWYVSRGTDEERWLIAEASKANPCLHLAYEDLFAADRDMTQRLGVYLSVLEFLGVPTDRSAWNEKAVRAVLACDRKLNTGSTFALIPNYAELAARRVGAA